MPETRIEDTVQNTTVNISICCLLWLILVIFLIVIIILQVEEKSSESLSTFFTLN